MIRNHNLLSGVASAVGPFSRGRLWAAHGAYGGFSLASLFAASEQGVWYDPSDLTSMYQDSAGTTAAAVGQPVGLMLDKSQGGPGPELVTNGDGATADLSSFKNSSGVIFSVVSGEIEMARSGAIGSSITFKAAVPATAKVHLTASIRKISGTGANRIFVRDASSTIHTLNGPSVGLIFTPNTTGFEIWCDDTTTIALDNVSVREIPGNHATQSTTASKPILRQSGALYYLEFDGFDDFLQTGSINFTSTDEMTVIAGVRNLASNVAIIAELSANLNSNAGTFYVLGGNSRVFASKGSLPTGGAQATPPVSSIPVTELTTGLGDISADSSVVRINGVQAGTSAADQGTGNYGNHPLYIGRRGGTSLPYNGHLYGLVVRGALTAGDTLTKSEDAMNAKTGAY